MPASPTRPRPKKFKATAAKPVSNQPGAIRLRGVRQNNLKGIDLDIPLGKLVVVTGLSGAGKSSLVFDTLHAEGQRRYVETFSPYIRQFLEMLDRPEVDSIENIRPSIAIEQGNTVKTSRSTVGTMTELCDYFKVWFHHQSQLIDPATGKALSAENPQSLWKQASRHHAGETVLIAFPISRPDNHTWQEIINSLSGQGYTRCFFQEKAVRLDQLSDKDLEKNSSLLIIADRISIAPDKRARFIEAATQAFHFGRGELALAFENGSHPTERHFASLHSSASGITYKPATPGLFSFNSPVGACPRCRGFGRIIEIDYRLVIPDESLSIEAGAIKPFQGQVYSESLRDLAKASKKHKITLNVPWRELSDKQRAFVMDGEPGYNLGGPETMWPKAWYGVRRFFEWLETKTYKMHVRVFLSKFRNYTPCPDCGGSRLQPEALNWKWRGHTLPDLYRMPVGDLYQLIRDKAASEDTLAPGNNGRPDLALNAILTRLHYLVQVGLDYLTLDRTSRSLSGGEVERVNLTACLGTSLTDTLFVLDEPSIGLHPRDIGQLISILKRLTAQGNTVVVVEHDEAVMRAADHLIEIGPRPGASGGHVVFQGSPTEILSAPTSLTGRYLAGFETVDSPRHRRAVSITSSGKKRKPAGHQLTIQGATLHNLQDVSVTIPLGRFVCLAGVSGSGKSTLLENVIYQNVLRQRGLVTEQPAPLRSLTGTDSFSEIVLVDQGPVSRTPRSNPALYCEAWDDIRTLFARTDAARDEGFTTSHFSFNGGDGRCDHCQGLGFERVEMQFLSDVYVPCPVCEGSRFKPEVLAIRLGDHSVADILAMDIRQARECFADHARIRHKLDTLDQVGLGYLTLGQPLNTLSGGESQRLKLVKYLGRLEKETAGALILLDEPTTGLHRDDVKRLITLLQKLVDHGHSMLVIEHQVDVLRAADWIIEMGPGAGLHGGRIIFTGTPEALAGEQTPTSPFMRDTPADARETPALAAEPAGIYRTAEQPASPQVVRVTEAREHNLRNLSLDIPHRQISVVTGVSGSGKSTLAFDIIFAEGQRRFMESMSAYARQFVEQLPRPDIGELSGIPPTVAIEQRITRGSRKSTVATVTEVAQYLRLLYAKIGIPHSPSSGRALVSLSESQVEKALSSLVRRHYDGAKGGKPALFLAAPVIRSRKGHHQPLADRVRDLGYRRLRIDGKMTDLDNFTRLDRYREHDIELVLAELHPGQTLVHGPLAQEKSLAPAAALTLRMALRHALNLGKKSCLVIDSQGKTVSWFSTTRADPDTGEAFPELDPKHFSWNSPKGWCPHCRGFGRLYSWMEDKDEFAHLDDIDDGKPCSGCEGTRLNPLSRRVLIPLKKSPARSRSPLPPTLSLPGLLALPPGRVLEALQRPDLDKRGQLIARDIIPEVQERLRFLEEVGLGYLTLDRASATLSGGEAQRIRLAAQLGSNLSGVLYVLDEPSIGLHARDNAALIRSLHALRDKENTLLIVEHDEDTMQAADRIIDLGPAAGIHGGQLMAQGTFKEILNHPDSPTGQALRKPGKHPWHGQRRPLPARGKNGKSRPENDWLLLQNPRLRNLKGDDLRLPLGRLSAVCGISGAGKSTLIRDLLKPSVAAAIKSRSSTLDIHYSHESLVFDKKPETSISGKSEPTLLLNGHLFRQCIEVDQEPIGKTPRSTPATYNGAFDLIREIFATLPEAKMRGFGPGAFSFNTVGGRCETCKGAGRIKLEMNFMPDTWTPCEDCGGTRFGAELADIRWNGKNIADVLAMSFEEAAVFFQAHSRLSGILQLMVETGLGYLTLGQSSPTLSGGEAQRLKLVSELALGLPSYREKSLGITRRNLYLLEEPTIGLHLSDCRRLVDLLHRLVDQGHTVVVIEHHPDIIAEADYLVEVGPEGGEAGGNILYQGVPEGLLKIRKSPTAPFLKNII